MCNGTDVVFTFDGTFDGFLCVVYHSVKNRVRPIDICSREKIQLRLDSFVKFIPTETAFSEKVRVSILEKMGYDGFKRTYYAFLSKERDGYMTAFTYLLYGFKYGKSTHHYMSVPDINRAYKLERCVSHEADRMKGFLRFSVMENGVEYARMEPDNDILSLVMPHFADRLKTIPFVIHDIGRKKAGVYANGKWFVTEAEDLKVLEKSEDEQKYRELWKSFYNSICIKERTNLKLQTSLMPKKYRKHMTEHML